VDKPRIISAQFDSLEPLVPKGFQFMKKCFLYISICNYRSVYNMTVEPSYFTETLPQRPQSIQLVIPGPPDSPEIFLKSVSPEEFVIEWGEPITN
jgi:hypothetical protein